MFIISNQVILSSQSTFFASVLYIISIFGSCNTLSCITFEQRSTSLLTRIVTFEAKFVMYKASSIATFHPQITTICLSRNIGNPPSQTAQQDIPLFQNLTSPGIPNLFGVAHVVTMIDFVSITWSQTKTLNGLLDKSTLSTVFVSILAQNLIACCLIRFTNSNHQIQSGNHGKFSISVVVVSCHPAGSHQAINHSNINGFNKALPV